MNMVEQECIEQENYISEEVSYDVKGNKMLKIFE